MGDSIVVEELLAAAGSAVIVMRAGPNICSSSVALDRAPRAARLTKIEKLVTNAGAMNQTLLGPRRAARVLC